MSDRDELRRHHALALAVETHTADLHTDDVLATATQYLGWLRQPTPAATLTLRIGQPVPK